MDRESFRTEMAERQHLAEVAFVQGDVTERLAMWSRNDPVTLFAGLGPSKAGWSTLEPMFRSVAARLSGGHDVAYEVIAADVSGDIGWTVGFARFTVSIDGGPATRHTLRLTHLYRREAGDWKVVHEHSDFQPADHQVPDPIT